MNKWQIYGLVVGAVGAIIAYSIAACAAIWFESKFWLKLRAWIVAIIGHVVLLFMPAALVVWLIVS